MLDGVLSECFENKPASFDVRSITLRNASVSRELSARITFPDKEGRWSHPISASATSDCRLRLSGIEWLECTEGSPEFYSTLFHEFGHAINSCPFFSISILASKAYKNMEGDTATSIRDLIYAQSNFDPNRLPNSNNLQLKVISQLATTESSAYQLGEALLWSTRCLSWVSNPKEAVLSSCKIKIPLGESLREHCGYGGAVGYPSQWDEAEADFWGASAFALWLKDEFKTIDQRQIAALSAIESWCKHGIHGDTPETMQERAHRIDKLAQEMAKAFDANDEESKKVIREVIGGREPSPCEVKPKIARNKPWFDPHQEWSHRVNKNYYMNSDLLEALGCPLPAAPMPQFSATCSPLEQPRLAIPQ